MIKLNVWKDATTIEKTYETEQVDIFWGTLEDVIEKIDAEKLSNDDKAGRLLDLGKAAISLVPSVRPMMKDIFPGITEDELKRCKVTEMARVIVDVVKYAYTGITGDDTGN